MPGERLRDVSEPRIPARRPARRRGRHRGGGRRTAAMRSCCMGRSSCWSRPFAARPGPPRNSCARGWMPTQLRCCRGAMRAPMACPCCGSPRSAAALANRRGSLMKLLVEHGAQYDIFTAAYVGDLDAVRELLDLAPALADARDPGVRRRPDHPADARGFCRTVRSRATLVAAGRDRRREQRSDCCGPRRTVAMKR